MKYLSKEGHVKMALAANKQIILDAKRNLWTLVACGRISRDSHMLMAREA
jgi:hypothetical protein